MAVVIKTKTYESLLLHKRHFPLLYPQTVEPERIGTGLKVFREQTLKAHNERRKKHGVSAMKLRLDMAVVVFPADVREDFLCCLACCWLAGWLHGTMAGCSEGLFYIKYRRASLSSFMTVVILYLHLFYLIKERRLGDTISKLILSKSQDFCDTFTKLS